MVKTKGYKWKAGEKNKKFRGGKAENHHWIRTLTKIDEAFMGKRKRGGKCKWW